MHNNPPNNNGQPNGILTNPYFVKHCMNCLYGWHRTTTQHAAVSICKLDQEPILMHINSCSEFTAKNP